MAASGQAAVALDTFDRSDQMQGVLNRINNQSETFIDYDDLGNSREAVYTITLLRIKGFTVVEDRSGILVTPERSVSHGI